MEKPVGYILVRKADEDSWVDDWNGVFHSTVEAAEDEAVTGANAPVPQGQLSVVPDGGWGGPVKVDDLAYRVMAVVPLPDSDQRVLERLQDA